MRSWIVALVLCLAAAGLSSLVSAHSGAKGVVKERMDHMGSIAASMKAMGKMFKGAEPFDPDKIRKLSASVSQHGGDAMLSLFPEETLQPPSDARPEIWANWTRFSELAHALKSTASALSDGADNTRGQDLDGSPEKLFKAVARTCKACHKDYRAEK